MRAVVLGGSNRRIFRLRLFIGCCGCTRRLHGRRQLCVDYTAFGIILSTTQILITNILNNNNNLIYRAPVCRGTSVAKATSHFNCCCAVLHLQLQNCKKCNDYHTTHSWVSTWKVNMLCTPIRKGSSLLSKWSRQHITCRNSFQLAMLSTQQLSQPDRVLFNSKINDYVTSQALIPQNIYINSISKRNGPPWRHLNCIVMS